MTDKEKFKALMAEFGVPLHESGHHTTHHTKLDIEAEDRYDGVTTVDGYSYFRASFEFDAEGKFVKVGIWE